MQTIKLQILKKNRIYYKCLTENGYEVKLRITPTSENLELGTQELLVNDVSIRTKYGTDVIYEMESAVSKDEGKCTLKSPYNLNLVKHCRELGGKWDKDNEVWVFPKFVEDRVEALEELYNTNIVTVEIEQLEGTSEWHAPVDFCGYVLATAWGRDSGAKVSPDVALLSGKVYSGGSVKNWRTCVSEGAKFRLRMSRNLLPADSGTWKVTVLEDKKEQTNE